MPAARGLFRAPATRPFLFLFPVLGVAVLVAILLAVWPMRVDTFVDEDYDCGPPIAVLFGSAGDWDGGWFVDEGGERPRSMDSPASACSRAWWTRVVTAGVLVGLALLPIAVYAVRGFLWGANALHDLTLERQPVPPE